MEQAVARKVRFTYSTADQPFIQRAVIQAIEKLGGQRKLKKLYVRHQENVDRGANFFDSAINLLRINVDFDGAALGQVPRTGPVLFISNHPYGVLDGVTLTWLALKVRPDTKVLANDVLCQDANAAKNLLPVAFAPTREARETNVRSRHEAQKLLKEGGAVGIFPGGGVSTSERAHRGTAMDLPWAPFTAKLVRMSEATVVPIYFTGQNSRLFQIASHLSLTLRLSLVFRETARRIGTDLKVRVGKPIPFSEIAHLTEREDMIRELRKRTYALAQPQDIKGPVHDLHLRHGRIKGWKTGGGD
ncbi:lysophospholipid acyltransferase family protein [Aestuariivirga litoralis]|uniref:lysophospholipid acyltransferase family protein n=1 Tax=Aestuariivirga litoralis TaxID=2650924 RepID=UPI0018C6E70D|nr:lysophospholipid acyltransferase family protein [Aestuariivirga litoralis]